MTILDIQRVVAGHFGVTPKQMQGASRAKALVRARQVAMYLSRLLLRKSYPKIGACFGGRHHTTAMHAVLLVERLWCVDSAFAGMVDGLAMFLVGGQR